MIFLNCNYILSYSKIIEVHQIILVRALAVVFDRKSIFELNSCALKFYQKYSLSSYFRYFFSKKFYLLKSTFLSWSHMIWFRNQIGILNIVSFIIGNHRNLIYSLLQKLSSLSLISFFIITFMISVIIFKKTKWKLKKSKSTNYLSAWHAIHKNFRMFRKPRIS